MASVNERDFSTFELGDNVYELAGGVIPETAELLGVKLSHEPYSAEIQGMLDVIDGRVKELQTAQPKRSIERGIAADLIDQAGTQKKVNRSLKRPNEIATPEIIDGIVLVTCMANWQDRAEATLPRIFKDKPVYIPGGQRIMDSPTEISNANVQGFVEKYRRYPSEEEYAGSIITAKLSKDGFIVLPNNFPSKEGEELLQMMFEKYPALLDSRLLFVRNANAGFITAIQAQRAARKYNSDFDTSRQQLFVITDEVPPARTDEQEVDSLHFQKTGPGVRQYVVLAKNLHEAGGGE